MGAYADDHREDHDLDPRTYDVAQHPFGEERCAVPQCERHKDEAGEARELELQYRDEELDRENEESCNDDHPGDHEHRDLDEIVEEVDWPDQLLRLFQQGPGRLEARSRQPSWKQQILRPDRAAACGQTEPGEASEYDVGQRRKTVQDQRERADIENLLEEFSDNIVLTAERPKEASECDVDADQDRGQESDIAAKQSEAAIDVGDERLHELVDDIEILHARTPE